MSILMIVFFAFLIYVSYFEIVSILFRGKQSNRFFATILCTVAPIFGSVPGIIIATKYERRIGGIETKINGHTVRIITIIMQMATVFMLFLPFFKSDGIYASGTNVIYGLTMGGETIFMPAKFLMYLIYAPFVVAVLNIVDIKHNISNVISYVVALVMALTIVLIAMYVDIDASLKNTSWLWVYAILNVAIMFLSEISIIGIRNKFLLKVEDEEEKMEKERPEDVQQEELIDNQESEPQTNTDSPVLPVVETTYKCSRCGNIISKGQVCPCREEKDTLSKILASTAKEEKGVFCVYCHRKLNEGEVCTCEGDGFGITITPELSERRKCQYCGQVLVGDSICVCEKIMKKSVPASPETDETDLKLYFKQQAKESSTKITDELAELERKINEQFSKVKENISNNE